MDRQREKRKRERGDGRTEREEGRRERRDGRRERRDGERGERERGGTDWTDGRTNDLSLSPVRPPSLSVRPSPLSLFLFSLCLSI